MNQLTELGIHHWTDKAFYHGYTDFYFQHLAHLQDKELVILEIGVKYGASLRMWKSFFQNSRIFGFDINNTTPIWQDIPKRIELFHGNQRDKKDLKSVVEYIGRPIDIIIDDGNHIYEDQQRTLGALFPSLKRKGGIYICEDIDQVQAQALTSKKIPYADPKDQIYYKVWAKEILIWERIEKPRFCECKETTANNIKCYACGMKFGSSITSIIKK